MVCFAVAAIGTTGCPKPNKPTTTGGTGAGPKEPTKEPTKTPTKTPTKMDTKTDTKTDTKGKTETGKPKSSTEAPPPAAASVKISEPKADAEIKIKKGMKTDVTVKFARTKFTDDATIWAKVEGDELKGVTVKDAAKGVDVEGKSEGKITVEAAADAKGSGDLIITVGSEDKKTKDMIKIKLKVE